MTTCIECCGETKLHKTSTFIYGKDYGPVWYCEPCRAFVGCHANSDYRSLGKAAGPATRVARKLAHAAFDPIWKGDDYGYKLTRGAAYSWLANQLNMTRADCHIGMLSETQAYSVVSACIKKRLTHLKETKK